MDELNIQVLPAPIANTVVACEGAWSNPHEQRYRLVEVFRATVRYLGGLALAARLEHGPGPAGESETCRRLFASLRQRGLTDGEWVGLTRELLLAWRSAPKTHPLPALVEVAVQTQLTGLEELLGMRRRETVALGSTTTTQDAHAIVGEHLATLVELLLSLTAFFHEGRVVLPLRQLNPHARQQAWLLHGPTPGPRGWRTLELGEAVRILPNRAIVVDPQGHPRLVLEPAVLCERASPELREELFFLERRKGKAVLFVAFPSFAEVWREDVFARLQIAVGE